MPPLPVLSGRECVRLLQRLGYKVVRQTGSHIRLHHPTRAPVTVPAHAELDRGTLRAILRVGEISADELLKLME